MKKIKSICCAIFLFFCCAFVFANSNSFYKHSIGLGFNLSPFINNSKNSDTNFNIHYRYNFNQMWGLQVETDFIGNNLFTEKTSSEENYLLCRVPLFVTFGFDVFKSFNLSFLAGPHISFLEYNKTIIFPQNLGVTAGVKGLVSFSFVGIFAEARYVYDFKNFKQVGVLQLDKLYNNFDFTLGIEFRFGSSNKKANSSYDNNIPTDFEIVEVIDDNKISYDNSYSSWTGADIKTLDTARNVDYLSELEKDIILEQNMARSNPSLYATLYIEPMLNWSWNGNVYTKPYSDVGMVTKEGQSAIYECIRDMKQAVPTSPLIPVKEISQAAKSHVADTGKSGIISHQGQDGSSPQDRVDRYAGKNKYYAGENIAYGQKTDRDIIVGLLIDDGVSNRGHRKNMLENHGYSFVGVATGYHATYGNMCVINYAR